MATQDIQINVDLSTGQFFNTVFKNGKLQLKEVGVDSLAQIIYEDSGYWISAPIEHADKFKEYKPFQFSLDQLAGSQYKISVSSSNDNVTWSNFVEVGALHDMKNTPSRYIKVKIELTSAKKNAQFIIDSFTTNSYNNDQIIVEEGKLKLNKAQMLNSAVLVETGGYIKRFAINKAIYKKVSRIRGG